MSAASFCCADRLTHWKTNSSVIRPDKNTVNAEKNNYLCWQAGCRACLRPASCVQCSWRRRNPRRRSHSPLALCWCGWSPPATSPPRTCGETTALRKKPRGGLDKIVPRRPVSHVRVALGSGLWRGLNRDYKDAGRGQKFPSDRIVRIDCHAAPLPGAETELTVKITAASRY